MKAPEYQKTGDWDGETDALISICIANFNGSAVIEACIQSVLDQEVDAPFEIVMHDDASTDRSLEIVADKFPSVKVLKSTKNVGFCISNNRMVENSSAEYVLLLNNDAVLRPGALSAFYTRALEKGQYEILGLPQYSMEDGALIDRGYEFDIFMNPIPQANDLANDVATATGACLWIPRAIWEQVEGFPEWFGSVAEDIYLCQAARLLGYRIKVLPNPGFDHWVGRELGGGKPVGGKLVSTTKRRALSERNKTAVMLICYPIATLLVLIPIHFIFLWMEALVLLLIGTPFAKLRAIYFSIPSSIVKHMRKIRQRRATLQRKRKMPLFTYIRRFKLFPWKLILLLRHGKPQIN